MTTWIDVIFGDVPLWNINRYTSELMFLSFHAKLTIAHCLLQLKQNVYCSSFTTYLKRGISFHFPKWSHSNYVFIEKYTRLNLF